MPAQRRHYGDEARANYAEPPQEPSTNVDANRQMRTSGWKNPEDGSVGRALTSSAKPMAAPCGGMSCRCAMGALAEITLSRRRFAHFSVQTTVQLGVPATCSQAERPTSVQRPLAFRRRPRPRWVVGFRCQWRETWRLERAPAQPVVQS